MPPCSAPGAPAHAGPPRHRSASSGRRGSRPQALEARAAPLGQIDGCSGAAPEATARSPAAAVSGTLNPLAPEFVPSRALLEQCPPALQERLRGRVQAEGPARSQAQRGRSLLSAQRAVVQPKRVETEWVEVTRRRAVRKATAGQL